MIKPLWDKVRVILPANSLELNGNNSKLTIPVKAKASWLKSFEKAYGFSLDKSNHRFAANDIDLVYQATLKGMGITGLPAYIANPHIQAGELIQLFPEVEIPVRPIYVVYHQKRYQSSKNRAFLDFSTQYFENSH